MGNPHISLKPPGLSAYKNDGCRCDGCRAGNVAYQRELREAYQARRDIYKVPHGTANGYVNYRCRCTDCIQAGREAIRASRQRIKEQKESKKS